MGRPVRYLASAKVSKEDIARRIAAEDGITGGTVCVLTSVEPCRTFEIYRNRDTKHLELQPRIRKCLFLVALAIGRQSGLDPAHRRHVALLVDEFHALPAADYPALLAELAKFGASLTLATQTLGALAAVGTDQQLLHAVFGNVDHIFAFNCAASDARVLAPELGAPLEPADLVELGDFQCYARLSHQGERLPAFHLRLDPPPTPDPVVRDLLAATSAACYGRDARSVAADREALLERIAQLARSRTHSGNGEALDDPGKGAMPSSRRNSSRPRRDTRQGSRPQPQNGSTTPQQSTASDSNTRETETTAEA